MGKALVSERVKEEVVTRLVDREPTTLLDGQVRVRSRYSGINYKDALGVTGRGSIFKTFPIVGGIDVAGEVVESKSRNFQVGESVTITGCGLGETHDGGYSTEVVDSEKNVVKLPVGLSPKEAMIYGTAGFTAALALERAVQNGQTPDKGPILVTGASGGVGQFAVSFFAKKGFEVWAMSGKEEAQERLVFLGAKKVLRPEEVPTSARPLDKGIYGGIVDNVGGELLASLIPHVNLWGNICSVGLAGGHELHTTVMPFILRGVSLLGTSSNNCTWDLRLKIWQALATDLKPQNLDSFVCEEVGLGDVLDRARALLDRKIQGRVLVHFQK